MRKLLLTITTIILSAVMCFSALTGCGLITTDNERDMNQVVATIQIDENAPKDTIYKKYMVMAYLNYCYMYEQYYGYSREQTFTLIIDSLVNNRIFVQKAIIEQYDQTKGWNVANYLSEEAQLDAKYSTYKAMNDLIDSYKDTDENEEKNDTLWETVRTTPTNAANKEKEVTTAEKNTYIQTGIIKEDTVEYNKAFNKVVELLRANELLGDNYDGSDLTKTIYFEQTLKNYQESELISATEKKLKDGARATFTFDKLETAYAEKYAEQEAWSNTQFVEKLSSATASDPILYGHRGKYGYVYNLLLGVDDILEAEISSIKTDLDENGNVSKEDYAEARREILNATSIKDLRSTWIASGYDFDGTKFMGDYTFTTEANSLPFKGVVEKIKDKDVEKDELYDKYKVTSLEEFTLDSFIDMMENYVYGATKTADTGVTNPSIYKKVTSTVEVEEYSEKINELLFAFSTDSGSLNTYKGYVIEPKPDGADAEKYMQEFADGARELITMGGSSYIMVATDYGYHVMFFSEVLDTNYDYKNLTDYLNAEYGDKTWTDEYSAMLADWDDYEDTDSYLYLLCDSLSSSAVSNAVSDYQRETLNEYRYKEDSTAVKLYQDRYADLMK